MQLTVAGDSARVGAKHRVCMFVRNPCDRDPRVLKEARTLAVAGHAVTVVATEAAGLPAEATAGGVRFVRVRVDPLHERLAKRPLLRPAARLLAQANGILRLVDYTIRAVPLAAGASVHHAHDLNTLLTATLARRRHGGSVVYDSHELSLEAGPSARMGRLRTTVLRRYEGALIRRADLVITVNDALAERLAERYAIERPLVVRNAAPAADAPRPSAALRDALSLSRDEQVVLYHGTLAPDRGLEQLVRAAALLDGATLLLLGDGPLRGPLEALAASLGLGGRVRFLDAVPPADVPAYVAVATVGVVPFPNTSPNNYLATPNKLFEYLMAGVPVAVSDFPELRRIVCAEDVGVVFDPHSAERIAAAVNDLLPRARDTAYRARIAEVARERYAWELDAATLVGAYTRLAGATG